jgi:peptidoglycan/LPS O-acetylase OafA/YrhL
MSYANYSELPYYLITLFLLALSAIILQNSRFYSEVTAAHQGGRFESIDGLRGFLALSVFFHHAVISQHFYQTGNWEQHLVGKELTFYPFLAHYGVRAFFMITGLLFWNKVIHSQGRMDAHKLFLSRVHRLTPLYFFSVFLVVLTVFAIQGFRLQEGPFNLLGSILAWLGFGFFGEPSINKVGDTGMINAGVNWTLAYEWAFYLFLPLMALFWRGKSFAVLLLVIYAYSFFVPGMANIKYFFFGMLTAYLNYKYRTRIDMKSPVYSLIAVACLVASYYFANYRSILFFVSFLIMAFGNSLFGLLISGPAKFLGTISYSIYLLHGIILFVVFRVLNHFMSVAHLSHSDFWVITGIIGVLVIFVCALSYRFIEHPFLATAKPTSTVKA